MNAQRHWHAQQLLAALLTLAPLTGCGAEPMAEMGYATMEMDTRKSAAPMFAMTPPMATAGAALQADGPAPASAAAAPAVAPALPRKIIYNGNVSLIVESLVAAEAKLLAMVEKAGGYLSETNVSGVTGTRRTGSWKLRAPAEGFATLMAEIARLGELESTRTDSQDVSQEFYDLEARVKVKKDEERRLVKILEEAAGKLSEILEVEKELSRVRSEIEQMEGRVRWLAHNAALSTINVQMTEIQNYEPPREPTFGERIARTYQASLGNLGTFLQGAVLAVVALVPWLVLIIPGLLVAWLVGRRAWRLAREVRWGSRPA